MTCPDLEQLEQFAAGRVSEERRSSVSTHLATCEPCRGRLAEVDANLRLAQRMAPPDSGQGGMGEGGMDRSGSDDLPMTPDETTVAPQPHGMGGAHPTLTVHTDPGRDTFVVRRKASPRTRQPPDRPSELVVPQQLGPVRLVREIGRGGMGAVFLGHDQLLRRDVAVKFLPDVVSGPEALSVSCRARGRRQECTIPA